MAVLKRVGILSCAKIYGILMAIMGFVIGLIYATILTVFGAVGAAAGEGLGAGLMAGLGFLLVLALPIFYGIIGFIFGALGAWLYNLLADWIGGIELEFED